MRLISHNAKLAIVLSRNCWYIQATSTNRVWNKVNREETATPPGGKRTADGRAAATTHTVAAATADAEAKTIAAKSSWRNWKGRERSLLVTVHYRALRNFLFFTSDCACQQQSRNLQTSI